MGFQLYDRCINIRTFLHQVAHLLINQADLSIDLSIVLFKLALDFKVLISLSVLNLQVLIIVDLFFYLLQLHIIMLNLVVNKLPLLVGMTSLVDHLSNYVLLLPEDVLESVNVLVPLTTLAHKHE